MAQEQNGYGWCRDKSCGGFVSWSYSFGMTARNFSSFSLRLQFVLDGNDELITGGAELEGLLAAYSGLRISQLYTH